MSRRTTHLSAESLEQRAMMAADLTGLGSTILAETSEPSVAIAESVAPHEECQVATTWLCGTTEKMGTTASAAGSQVNAANPNGGGHPLGSFGGVSGSNPTSVPTPAGPRGDACGITPWSETFGFAGTNQGGTANFAKASQQQQAVGQTKITNGVEPGWNGGNQGSAISGVKASLRYAANVDHVFSTY
jgi:hypothetical protein